MRRLDDGALRMNSFPKPLESVVLGAAGGIGAAIAERLEALGPVRRFSRADGFDLTDEASIQAAAEQVGQPRLLVVATGHLHGHGAEPEKRLADLSPERLAYSLAVNAVGPALVLKHFAPRMPRAGKSVIAVLSARVGSISDNRLGGWYGYRASKAALNQMVRTASIELAVRRPDLACVALHPGTVDTGLSAPFQKGVAPERLFTPQMAADHLLKVIDGLSGADTGRFLAWDGREIPF